MNWSDDDHHQIYVRSDKLIKSFELTLCMNDVWVVLAYFVWVCCNSTSKIGDSRGRDRMIVSDAISAYPYSRVFKSSSWRVELDKLLFDKVCQWSTAGRWFSPGNTVSSVTIKLKYCWNRNPTSKMVTMRYNYSWFE